MICKILNGWKKNKERRKKKKREKERKEEEKKTKKKQNQKELYNRYVLYIDEMIPSVHTVEYHSMAISDL